MEGDVHPCEVCDVTLGRIDEYTDLCPYCEISHRGHITYDNVGAPYVVCGIRGCQNAAIIERSSRRVQIARLCSIGWTWSRDRRYWICDVCSRKERK